MQATIKKILSSVSVPLDEKQAVLSFEIIFPCHSKQSQLALLPAVNEIHFNFQYLCPLRFRVKILGAFAMFSERWPRSSRVFDVHDLFMCFDSSLQPHIFSLTSRRQDMIFLRILRVSKQRGQFKKCESGKRSFFLLCNGISPNVRVRVGSCDDLHDHFA